MEIKFDDHVISFSGLSSWKRFMLLIGFTAGAYQLTITPGVDPIHVGGAWSMVLMGWTYYFVTHKGESDPDVPMPERPVQVQRPKTKEEMELEIFNGSGKFLNQSPE